MSLRIEYHELVDTDLEHAWNWHEDQQHGLGDRLLEATHATVVTMAERRRSRSS